MKQFKYLKLSNPSQEELDNCGKEGWELVSVIADFNGEVCFFKQAIESNPKHEFIPNTIPSDEEKYNDAVAHCGAANKLMCVKYIKETYNLGLKEAKDIVDKYSR